MTALTRRSMTLLVAVALAVPLAIAGCGNRAVTGAAVGGAAAGGAYEYQNKRALDRLEHQYESGEISRDEYERRKDEIEDRSLVY